MKKYALVPITEDMEKDVREFCNEDHCEECFAARRDGCMYYVDTVVRVENNNKLTAMALLEQINNITMDYEERELSEIDFEGLNHEQLVCISSALLKIVTDG